MMRLIQIKWRQVLLIVALNGFFGSFPSGEAVAQKLKMLHSPVGRIFFEETEPGEFSWKYNSADDSSKVSNPRLAAIALDVTLGVFGMHRLYLGTDVKVPIFYTCTVGGGMILWLADLGCLIFTEDISIFENNPNIFMWVPAKTVENSEPGGH